MNSLPSSENSVSWKNKNIIAGGTEKLSPKTDSTPQRITISDDDEPIEFLQKSLEQTSGKKLEECRDLEIKGHFVKMKEGGPIKIFAYRAHPERVDLPSCYYFEREWTAKLTDKDGNPKEIIFTKKIYTNVNIPTKTDEANFIQDTQYIANLAASTYANFIELVINGKSGNPKAANSEYLKIKEHVNKVQRDNFLHVELYEGRDQITQENLTKNFSNVTHVITAARIRIREGERGSKEERLEVHFDKNFLDKINTKAGDVFTKGQRMRQKQFVLFTDENSSPEIKEISKIHHFRQIKQDALAGKNLVELLANADIDENQFTSYLQKENLRYKADYDDRLNFFQSPVRLNILRNLYAPGYGQVSDEILSLLPKTPSTSTDILLSLAEQKKEADNNSDLAKELDLVIACYYKAYQDMQGYSEKMFNNERQLHELATDDQAKANLEQATKGRLKTLENINEMFERYDITAENTKILAKRPATSEVLSKPEKPNPYVDFGDEHTLKDLNEKKRDKGKEKKVEKEIEKS